MEDDDISNHATIVTGMGQVIARRIGSGTHLVLDDSNPNL
jgi:hypothetical protein